VRAITIPTKAGAQKDDTSTFRERMLRAPERVRFWASLILLCMAALEALSQMHDADPDAMSYLDAGSAFWRHDPVWINALWSPFYGIVSVGVFRLLALSSAWQFAVCHLMNFLLYGLALLAFNFFLTQLVSSLNRREPLPPNVVSCFYLLAFAVFLEWNHPLLVWISPDLGVTACLVCAAALLLRIKMRAGGALRFCLLGVVLGVGYLVKSPGLPLGLALFAAAFFYLGRSKRTLLGLTQAFIPFVLLVAAWAVPLSQRYGYATTGESATLNYAWHVHGVRYIHWQGDSRNGQPIHPTRKLLDAPEVFAFGEPVHATYAAYYDPAYWFAGLRTSFSFHDQAAALLVSFKEYAKFLLTWQNSALLLTICFLVAWNSEGGLRSYYQTLRPYLPVVLFCIFGMAMYGLVHVESRYVTTFAVVAWPILLVSALAMQPRGSGIPVRLLWPALIVVLGSTLVGEIPEMARGVSAFRMLGHPESNPDWVVARESQRFGLRPGDRVAVLGYSFNSLWARLGGYRIVAEVPVAANYWAIPPALQQIVHIKLRSEGARFLIAGEAPSSAVLSGWQPIASGYFILPLEDPVR
jgi:hypothetical protein